MSALMTGQADENRTIFMSFCKQLLDFMNQSLRKLISRKIHFSVKIILSLNQRSSEIYPDSPSVLFLHCICGDASPADILDGLFCGYLITELHEYAVKTEFRHQLLCRDEVLYLVDGIEKVLPVCPQDSPVYPGKPEGYNAVISRLENLPALQRHRRGLHTVNHENDANYDH